MSTTMKYSPIATPTTPTWRPYTLRVPFLSAFCFLCLLVITGIELILHGCSTSGCRIFGKASISEISPGTYFVYNLLPTIISLVLGLCWTVVHHDALRLEPYFQMSAPGGASAAYSIFLKYPYTILVAIPFQAIKRGHYIVLLSSINLLLMNILITPLLSGIFDDASLSRSSPQLATTNTLHPSEYIRGNLTAGFNYLAYDYAWLNGTLPPFTTPEYALLPVRAADDSGATWTAETTLFEADLDCKTAESKVFPAKFGGWLNLNVTAQNFSRTVTWGSKFPGPWNNIADLEYDGFTQNGVQNHVYAFSSGVGRVNHTVPTALTTRVCTTSYHSQDVIATWTGNGEVVSVNRTGERRPFEDARRFAWVLVGRVDMLTAPKRFQDVFEKVAGFGYFPLLLANVDSQLVRRFGRCSGEMEGVLTELVKGGLERPSKSRVLVKDTLGLAGFAMWNTTDEEVLEGMLKEEELDGAYRSALKMLFAVAVATEMVDGGASVPVMAVREVSVKGFRVNELWARGTQGGLGAVVIIALVMAVLIWLRPCELDGEPNSLAASLRVLAASPELCRDMEGAEYQTMEKLQSRLDGRRYTLSVVPGQGPRVGAAGELRGGSSLSELVNEEVSMEDQWPMQTIYGVALLVCFATIVALLVAAFGYSRTHNGLPTFAPTNSFKYKTIFSYIPIVISMGVEIVLVSLGSCFCMLAPYKALHGSGTSSSPLTMDYDKSPPHFQVFRSLRDRDIALAALTTGILLSNVLAVAFAGLFSPTSLEFTIQSQVQIHPSPTFKGNFTEPALESYYTLSGNLSGYIPIPSWTTTDYYVVPFFPVASNGIHQYQAPTWAVGAEIKCEFVPEEIITLTCLHYPGPETTTNCTYSGEGSFDSNYITVDDPCWRHLDPSRFDNNTNAPWTQRWNSPTGDAFVRSLDCPETFFMVWAERPANPNPTMGERKMLLYLDNLEAVILKCEATETVAKLTATVNNMQQVLSTEDLQPLSTDEITAFYPPNTSSSARLVPTFLDTVLTSVLSSGILKAGGYNHNIQWFNYLLATLEPSLVRNKTNVTHIPDTENLVTTVEDVFRRLFATNLALYSKDVFDMGALTEVPAPAVVQRDRVQVNFVMFVLGTAIMVYIMAVITMLYLLKRQELPGQLPVSLAGMYALLYASNAKGECGRVPGSTPRKRAKRLMEIEGKYSYGTFIGENGVSHVGVYREGGVKESTKSLMTATQG